LIIQGAFVKILVIIFISLLSFASPYEGYFEGAAKTFGIESALLKRIAMIESSMNPRALNLNKNGTYDLGLMQINTIHLKRLGKIGVTRDALMDPEVNIYVGALLLSSHIRKRGYNLDAIGNYHSANPLYKTKWLKRLAMAIVPEGLAESSTIAVLEDPRSRFVQVQLSKRTEEKISQGIEPKRAWREAKAEVNRLMGYTKKI
jgi:soluble lytic murein transglycosylase-like protein